MANRNIFEALNTTPEGGAPKNPFDCHSFEWLTSKAGQFIPVGFRECVPDGTYDMSVDNYTLTFPCNTASQADMKENYYFLFVPYYQLTRNAYSFTVARKDNHSALDYQFEQMPWFPLGDVVARCIQVASVGNAAALEDASLSDFIDIHGFNIAYGALRVLDLAGYGCYLDFLYEYIALRDSEDVDEGAETTFLNQLKKHLNDSKPNALRLAAYQKSWYCYFRNSIYDNAISPRCFNFDDVTYPSDTTYNILDYRDVDDFIIECCQLRYVQNKKDVVSASMPGTQFGAVSSVPISSDLIGTATIPFVSETDSTSFQHNPYLARLDSSATAISGYAGIIVGTDDGSGTDPGHYQTLNNLVTGDNNWPTGSITRPQVSHKHPDGVASFSAGTANLFDVLQLVEAEAIQKWRQKAMMAGQKTKDNWKAHYGVVPRHMVDDYPDFIGSVDNIINISQVVSQANTLNAEDGKTNLGDIAGRGYGASSDKKFRFHATEYGVVILCRAVISENVYASFGLDRANQLIYYTDFWQPEFQNIGLEAVSKQIIDSIRTNQPDEPTGVGGDSPLPSTSTVIGYAPRNYQLKSYLSKVHGLFNPSRFAGEGYVPSPSQEIGLIGYGQLESFVQIRRDVIQKLIVGANGVWAGYGIPIGLAQLYVSPAVTNSTFGFEADDTEETDVFIHKCRFNFTAVQPLSVLGLPQF